MSDPMQTIKRNFTHIEPDINQKIDMTLLEAEFTHLAEQIATKVSDTRERSLAITRLEEAKFWTMAAIARRQP